MRMAAFLALFEGATENEKATPSSFFVALSLHSTGAGLFMYICSSDEKNTTHKKKLKIPLAILDSLLYSIGCTIVVQ